MVPLFIAAEPGQHLAPFARLGTGSINLLVFALLTFIAELKDKQSVIFAMEEPEIALPLAAAQLGKYAYTNPEWSPFYGGYPPPSLGRIPH